MAPSVSWRRLEHFQCETLRVSHHTAWRFAEKTRFFRLVWPGGAVPPPRVSLFSKMKRSSRRGRLSSEGAPSCLLSRADWGEPLAFLVPLSGDSLHDEGRGRPVRLVSLLPPSERGHACLAQKTPFLSPKKSSVAALGSICSLSRSFSAPAAENREKGRHGGRVLGHAL